VTDNRLRAASQSPQFSAIVQRTNFADFATVNLMQKAQIKLTMNAVKASLRNAITKADPMPALTIRNIPDDVHWLEGPRRAPRAQREAEVRELIAAAVKPEPRRLRMGEALAAIWAAAGDDRRGTCGDRRCAGSRTGKSGEF
jgi:plasmid stability protein